jgi:hypothetical protein
MNDVKTPPEESLWQKTQFANLVRYIPSGIYFARFRVRGKLIRKSSLPQIQESLGYQTARPMAHGMELHVLRTEANLLRRALR